MAFIPKDARWYLADVILEHVIGGDTRNVIHINMHLIEASSPEQAYEKAQVLGAQSEDTYLNSDGKQVRVIFRGLRDLNVIHEELEDGAELAYSQKVALPEAQVRAMVREREQLAVFAPAQKKNDVPNLMPETVMEMLEQEGFTRNEIEERRRG